MGPQAIIPFSPGKLSFHQFPQGLSTPLEI
jgi:hypothetical protein